MRAIGIVLFALLATQIALRLLRPTPTPDWYRLLVLATAVGIILCLVGPPIVARFRRPGTAPAHEQPPTGP
jgi:hypothetical protein